MDAVGILATAIWAMLPAYLPNNVAVVAGGGPPIDGGRTIGGRRVLGDGKTWRGTIAGIVVGFIVAVLLDTGHTAVGGLVGVTLPGFPFAVAMALPLGAMGGDLVASAVKRRLDRPRGESVPLLDQLDFVVGALLVVWVIDPTWAASVLTVPVVVTVLVVTPVLHVLTNGIAYLLGVKDVPW